MEQLVVPQGTFGLDRWPVREREQLRAWDAADELLLHHVAEAPIASDGPTVLVDDAFGALAVALADRRPTSITPSHLARRATGANLAANGLDPEAVTFCTPLDEPPAAIGTVLLKVPKSLGQLEDELHRLRPSLGPGTIVVAAAMAKHIHRSTLELFERIVGPTRTSRATKKARLVFASVDPALDPGPTPWPKRFRITELGIEVVGHAGTHSPDRLDLGTRTLLEHLPTDLGAAHVVDLGCGTGIIGTVLAQGSPEARLTFVDESAMAVASSEATFRATLGPDRPARFVVGDGLADLADGPPIEPGSVDLVVCNPPFHDDHAVTDATAWQMFTEAREALRPDGELWVVGNRHLSYHAKLRRLFGNSAVTGASPKFVVLRSRR